MFKRLQIKSNLLSIILALIAFSAFSQNIQRPPEKEPPKPLTRILFVFDGSQSMLGKWQSDTKFHIASRLFISILDSLKSTKNLSLALRVYGHQKPVPPQDCNDTRLEVPFAPDNIERMKHVVARIIPKGTTPIAYSLQQTVNDFPPCDNCRNIVILITDGLEECGGDPCAVSHELQQKGIILKPFIIGIGKNFKESFDCVGAYYDATNETEFRNALNVVISRALNPTTAQVNLLDQYGKPTETNVNMTFYDNLSGKIKYNFIHSLNNKGLPDTLEIDPLLTYDIIVHTIPPVRKDSVKLTPGKHTTIGLDAPQGYLSFRAGPSSTIKFLPCLVRESGKNDILNVQQFDQVEKYLTGSYDVEVLCLPRISLHDVKIVQSNTTMVEIPVPGIAVIQKSTNGYGSLYLVDKNGMTWLYNLRDTPQQQETLYLQPGSYTIIFRSKYSNRSEYSIEKKFTVEGGQTTNVRLYVN